MGRSPSRERKRPRSASRERNGKRSRSRSPDKKSRKSKHEDTERVEGRSERRERSDRDRSDKDRSERDKSEKKERRKKEERARDRSRERGHDREREKDRGEAERKRGRDEEQVVVEDDTVADVKQEANGGAEEKPQVNGNGSAVDVKADFKPKAEPLSLEELLKRRQAEEEARAKPVFLTKKQREELALQRLAEKRAAASAGVPVRPVMAAEPPALDSRNDGRRDNDRRRDRDRRDRDDRARRPAKETDDERAERERQQALEMIKQQYLGAEKAKKKLMKASDKFRFNFDWDAVEDTSKDLNPLYNKPHEAMLLFGRGLRAGIDRREQKKALAEAEQELRQKLRAAAGIKETAEDRDFDKKARDAADKYDAFDMRIDTHWSSKKREDMTERDWRIFREDFNISYRGGNPTLPVRNWEEAKLPELLVKAIDRHGYKKPSPIQMAAIPLGMQQRDVIGIAETGSGKTAAFVLPMLSYIMKQPVMKGNADIEAEGPYAVVLAPTRELAQQIEDETKQLAHYTDYRVVSVVGGLPIEDQGFQLRRGCEIVVATPGRLVDCLERQYAVLNQCNYVVLDEADRMIDLGFEPQVQGVLDAMPSSNLKPEDEDVLANDKVYRTTYMFSATMPPAVERLARKYLRRPVIVQIGTVGRATDNVAQKVYMVKDNEKEHRLAQELEDLAHDKKVIVFANTKNQCDRVTHKLEELDYSCTVLHGGKSQDQREASLAGFKEGKFNVLVATDVAGRGIDVQDVALVVNFDMPHTIEAYTHRIGRTGRAGRKGVAVTFLTGSNSDQGTYYDLKKLLEESKAHVPPELARHEAAKIKPGQPGQQKRETIVYSKK